MVDVNSNHWSLWYSMHLSVRHSSTQLSCTVQSVVLEATLAKDRRLLSFKVEPMRFDEERFPLPDPEQLALHLINELSGLAPLTGTVQLPISAGEQSALAYRHWRAQAGIGRVLFQSGNE